jgi:hypothetical protein
MLMLYREDYDEDHGDQEEGAQAEKHDPENGRFLARGRSGLRRRYGYWLQLRRLGGINRGGLRRLI